MSEKREQKNVVFRRIGGRVVPIIAGASLIKAAGSEKAYSSEISIQKKIIESRLFKPKDRPFGKEFAYGQIIGSDSRLKAAHKFTYAFKKKYKDAINSAGNPRIFFSAFGPMGGAYYKQDGARHLEVKGKSSIIALHELGHSQAYFKKSKLANLGDSFSKPIGKLYNAILDSNKLNPRVADYLSTRVGSLYSFSKTSGTLISESDAWRRAFKMTKNKTIKKAMRQSATYALQGYAAAPIARGLRYSIYAAGASAIGYGLLKKGEK